MEKPKHFEFKFGIVWIVLILFFPIGLVLLWFYVAKPLIGRRKAAAAASPSPDETEEISDTDLL